MDILTFFSKNLNQRSLTPRWPLTPCLLRSHVWLYPRIIVSKSHDNTSMYVDTVINFAKYNIHTYTYYVHTTYYVLNEWSHSLLLNSVQARQKSDLIRKKNGLVSGYAFYAFWYTKSVFEKSTTFPQLLSLNIPGLENKNHFPWLFQAVGTMLQNIIL